LITAIAEQPASLFLTDEINSYFATIKSAGGKASHLSGIFSTLMKLYSQAGNSAWKPKGYGDSKSNKIIAYPHCCLYGTGTPDGFWGAVKTSDAVDGFLARIMVVESPLDYPRLRNSIPFFEPYQDMVDMIRDWGNWWPPGGNLSAGLNPQAMIVPFDSSAQKRLTEHSDCIEDRILNETDECRAVWARASASAQKMAMIFAASRGVGESMIVTKRDADLAVLFVNWTTRLLLRRVFTHVSENEAEAKKKRALEVIRKFSPILWRDFTRKTQGWIRDEDERDKIVMELLRGEYIDYEPPESKDKGKKGIIRIVE
jgi:hypothetical protein